MFCILEVFKIVPLVIKNLAILYVAFKFIDFATGILKAIRNGNFTSRKMKDGILIWIAELIAIIFVILIDWFLNFNFYLSGLTLALFVANEGTSIFENLRECKVNLPNEVTQKLNDLKSTKNNISNKN